MKKIIACLIMLVMLFPQTAFALSKGGDGYGWRLFNIDRLSSGSTGSINAADRILAFSFAATTTSAITHVNISVRVQNDPTGQNFKIRIETDDGGDGQNRRPSGTLLGTATSSFAGPAATGFMGEKALGTNTGALTIGTIYWALLYEDGTGNDPDSTDRILWMNSPDNQDMDQWMVVNCTSTCTGTPGWVQDDRRPPQFVFKHADNSFSGIGIDCNGTCSGNTSGASDIFDTNKQGIRVKFGSQVIIRSACFVIDKSGTPGDITATLYEADTSKDTITYPETTVGNTRWTCFFFDDGDLLAADTFIHIILSQAGASGSNDYDVDGFDFNSIYYSEGGVRAQNFDFVSGTSGTPSSLTVETDWIPRVMLVFDSLDTDFDQAAGGAGAEPSSGYSN